MKTVILAAGYATRLGELTTRYLAQFPEYERTFQINWVQPDDGARFA